MIDLHNHILPGIDDGSDSIESTRSMARSYLEMGVTRLAATPHIRPGMFNNDEADIRALLAEVQADFAREGIGLELRGGAEYYWDEAILEKLETPGTLLTLAEHGRHLLVEFSHMMRPVRLREALYAMKLKGINMVMAHPERYSWLADDLDFAEDLVAAGMIMQGTLSPLSGMWGTRPRKTLKRLLDMRLIHLISSDVHINKQIKAYYGPAVERLRDWVGAPRARQLLVDNPALIYEGKALVT